MCLGQLADSIHSGNASVCIFPYQLLTVQVAPDDHWPPSKKPKVEHTVIPEHARRRTCAILPFPDSEQYRTLCVIGIEAAGAGRARIVNYPAAGDYRARTALFNPFHMTKPARHTDPQTSDIRGIRGQRFRALSQDRQGEMRITAARRVSLWDVGRDLAAAVQPEQLAVVNDAAVAG